MCGIAGYIGDAPPSESRTTTCLKLMGRRGPDAEGLFRHTLNQRHTVLLHSRLKIIDLQDRSNQPFTKGIQTMVYNGEIYNYKELKEGLIQNGRSMNTEGDTEVLLETWITRGEIGLSACEGMWAWAIYNSETGRLTLSRDRFGEKPLYLYQDSTGLYFGSEIKFITALSGHALPLNSRQLYRYLIHGYRSLYKRPETFFEGVQEVAPGNLVSFDPVSQTMRTMSYWTPRFTPDASMSFEQAARGVRERLIRSVELRLRADVPLAFCMSGGVDSNSLISIAKRHLGYDVHGFTIVNADPRYRETETVDQVVAELGIRHTAVPLSTHNFLEHLAALVRQHDAPVYTISYYVQWRLMEAIARSGYKISLSGTGADELLSGYYDHHLAYLYDIRTDAALLSQSRINWAKAIQPQVRNPFLKNPDLFIENPDFRDHLLLNADHFTSYLKSPWAEAFIETHYTDGLLRNRMLNELFHEAVPVILHEDDLNAMYYSIENRSPFLDSRLFEFCYSIPTPHLIQNGLAKAVLREAMRGLVPECVLTSSRKVGFNAPIQDLLDIRQPDIREALLEDSPIYDVFQRDKIAELLQQPELTNSQSKFLFNFINSKIFLEQAALPCPV